MPGTGHFYLGETGHLHLGPTLQSHHLRFRSARGPDEPWNRTTLCAFHHQRGVHAGLLRIRGRAPEALVFELGFGSFGSGDVRIA